MIPTVILTILQMISGADWVDDNGQDRKNDDADDNNEDDKVDNDDDDDDNVTNDLKVWQD